MLLFLTLLFACPKGGPPRQNLQVATFEAAWQRVNETYPYADFKGLDWQAVHDELLPRARSADDAEALRPVLADMLGRLKESHFQVVPGHAAPSSGPPLPPEEEGSGCVGVEVALVEGALRTSRLPANGSGLGLGWELRGVNGQDLVAPVAEMVAGPAARMAPLHAANLAQEALCGAPGSVARLSLRTPAGQTEEVSLTRAAPTGDSGAMGLLGGFTVHYEDALLANNTVGYLRFNLFMLPVPARFEASLARFREAGATGLIVDLRGNPGGLAGMASGLSGFLLPEKGHSLGVMVTREAQLDLNIFPRPAGQQWKGRVALLVDGGSASTSEIFAAGLRELGRARVFGERTAGAALPSTFERLPNGDRIQLAMADLTTPKGYRIEGQGVVPDTAAPHTAASLAAGQDAALLAALAWLQSPETP